MKDYRFGILIFSIFVLLNGICSSVYAQSGHGERILKFTSDIEIHQDSSMTVEENITVRAEHVEIKRGIYRDFPTRYRDRHGNRINVQFDVLAVLKDGRPENYTVENIANGKRVRIGNPDVFLNRGQVYTYTIEYKTNRQIGYLETFDELYWNVTGNGWGFNIDEVTATIRLPEKVSAGNISLHGYTGLQGSTGEDYSAWIDDNSVAHFKTTKMLRNLEGLTVSVTFPKGIVREPTDAEKTRYLLMDNLVYLIGIIGILIVLIYYLFVWSRVGRDLPKGTIIPLFEPPDGFSPGAVRYVTRMGYDNKIFAALVINLAVKGYINIKQSDKNEYSLEKVKPVSSDDSELTESEESVLDDLLGARESIVLKQKNHAKISKAISNLQKILNRNFNNIYFKTNSSYLIMGIVLSIMTAAGMIWAVISQADEESIIMLIMTMIFGTVGVGVFVFIGLPQVGDIFTSKENRTTSIFLFVFGLLFLVVFGGIVLLMAHDVQPLFNPLIILLITLGLIGLNYLFYHLMKAPTEAGRIVLDQIEGFKMYLTHAEKDHLESMNPPERTPHLFEKFLPYALALDVENRWSEQFADVLKKAGIEGKEYSPRWYHGQSFSRLGAAGFASAVGGSMTSAISSSSTAPGSGSGSGGGGVSGGGGGGGGGGGW